MQSALNTLVASIEHQPKSFLLVGFASGIEPELSIGDCLLATEVIQYELDLGFSDMESYGVALAAKMQNIPCTVCRVISDDGKGHRPKSYKKFCMKANQMFVEVLYSLLELPREKSPTNL